MTALLQDLRFAVRAFARAPGFALIAIVTLAIGIGANTAIFSFVQALLLRPLPVQAPAQLVSLGPGAAGVTGTGDRPQTDHFSYAQYQALREDNDAFETVAAGATFSVGTTVHAPQADPADAEVRSTQLVSGEYFALLGLQPALGRLLDESDNTAPGANPVAVISHTYWTSRLDARPGAVSSTLILQGVPFQIVGIAPPRFIGHAPDNPADLWVPLTMQPQLTRRESMLLPFARSQMFWLNILARLRPGVSIEQAEARLNVRMQQIFLAGYGGDVSPDLRADLETIHIELAPAGAGLSAMRAKLRAPLTLLWAATGLILLIGCANLANILLARASDRRREISIRRALGAGGGRVVRQMLTESALLAVVGGAAGIALASWLIPTLKTALSDIQGPNRVEVGLDGFVLAFSCAVSALTVLLFGLAPALWAARRNVSEGLKAGARGATPSRGHAFAKAALVAGQTTLSVVLLAGAGLFLRTLAELRAVDLGIDPDNVIALRTNGRRAGLPPEGDDATRRLVLQRIRQIPAVVEAAVTTDSPVSGNYSSTTVQVSGYQPAPDESTPAVYKIVSDGYFELLGIGLVEGRMMDERDRYDQACFVSAAFARRYFHDRDPIGGVIDSGDRKCAIEGVVEDVHEVQIRGEPSQIVYRPALGYGDFLPVLLARVAGEPASASEAIRAAFAEAAPALPVNRGFSTLRSVVDRALTVERLLGRVTTVFAAVALLLAAIGLFGLLSYVVRQRTAEIGLRQALGATQRDVLILTIRQGATPVLLGAIAGLAGAVALGRGIQGMLYAVQPTDAVALGSALAALLAAGFLAALLPARRAARIQPTEALRQD
jgi:predicted permease